MIKNGVDGVGEQKEGRLDQDGIDAWFFVWNRRIRHPAHRGALVDKDMSQLSEQISLDVSVEVPTRLALEANEVTGLLMKEAMFL